MYSYSTEEVKLGTINLYLFSTLRVLSVKKKTTANFFRDLKEGDVFTFALNVNLRGTAYVEILDGSGNKVHQDSSTRFKKIVESCFELEDIGWEPFLDKR